jgi:type IV pilus assembly protein PilC
MARGQARRCRAAVFGRLALPIISHAMSVEEIVLPVDLFACLDGDMALITSAPSGSRSSPAQKKPAATGFWASQELAKQKAYEKKAKNYKLPLGELAVFTQQLASLLAAGLPLVQCLEALQDQTEDPYFRIVIRDVRADISQGNSLSSACRKFPKTFNNLFLSMVEAGEASGGLAEILAKVAGYFEASVKLTKKVKSAMTYPIAVIGLAIALVNVLLIFVIPVFADMFRDFGAKLPAPTQMLIDASEFLKSWWWAVGLALYGAFFVLNRFVATPNGRRVKDNFLVRAPVFGNLVHKIALSRFCRTYATLIRSGVPILRTLEIVAAASGKTQIEEACVQIAKHVSSGGQVSEVMASNEFFPPMMKHMVKAGESTGNVDGMMNKVADFYDVECESIIASLTSLIEPMLIVFLGIVVGGMVMAMFLPIFQMGAVAGGMQ